MIRLIILYIQFKGSRQIRVDLNFCESPSENWGIKSLGIDGKLCLFYHFSDHLLKRKCAFFLMIHFRLNIRYPKSHKIGRIV